LREVGWIIQGDYFNKLHWCTISTLTWATNLTWDKNRVSKAKKNYGSYNGQETRF